mmetsp:Transcript_82466/g.229874  ORF Transcript_82466/g.229874 Transcript_82466/m.229874 type:complete len:490 (+) Transcript_82466:175-1644(+)
MRSINPIHATESADSDVSPSICENEDALTAHPLVLLSVAVVSVMGKRFNASSFNDSHVDHAVDATAQSGALVMDPHHLIASSALAVAGVIDHAAALPRRTVSTTEQPIQPWQLPSSRFDAKHVDPTLAVLLPLCLLISMHLIGYVMACFDSSNGANESVLDYEGARRYGWLCNCVAFSSCAGVMAAHSDIFRDQVWPLEPGVVLVALELTLFDFGRNVISLWFQRELYCHYFGMSHEDRRLVMNRRDTWKPGVEVERVINRYGILPVKIMDAANRRFGHIIHFSIHVQFFLHVSTARFALQLHVLWTAIRLLTHVALEYDDWLGWYDYSGARMRDGQLGRFNLIVVAVWGGCGKVMLISLFIVHFPITDYDVLKNILVLALQPVIFGDTAAEIIGSFFGRLEFHVRGFGEVNKKTIEGVLACFVASYFSMLAAAYFLDKDQVLVRFKMPRALAFMIAACVATVMETLSLRGTDNFFILLGTGCALLVFM